MTDPEQLTLSLQVPNKAWMEFLEYHRDNPHIYEDFKLTALMLIIERRYKHIGAMYIVQTARYERALKATETQDEFNINNNYAPAYARLFVEEYPQYRDYLEFRKSKFDMEAL